MSRAEKGNVTSANFTDVYFLLNRLDISLFFSLSLSKDEGMVWSVEDGNVGAWRGKNMDGKTMKRMIRVRC